MVSIPFFEKIAYAVAQLGNALSHFQVCYRSIGRKAKLGRRGEHGKNGRETVRKVVDWLRTHGLLISLETGKRDEDGQSEQGANVYALRPAARPGAARAPARPGKPVATRAKAMRDHWNAAIAYFGRFFRLHERPGGLNTTPLASRPAPLDPARPPAPS
jgi:hypothetical protein